MNSLRAFPSLPPRTRDAALAAAIDTAEDGVRVTDRFGGVLHENRRLRDFVEQDTEGGMLVRGLRDAWHSVIERSRTNSSSGRMHADDMRPVEIRLRTGSATYRVRATPVREVSNRAIGDVLIVLWIRRNPHLQFVDPTKRVRYGLTAREWRVALLISAGSATREIGESLGISVHTARRHIESVLRKLAIHSRAAVRDRLAE